MLKTRRPRSHQFLNLNPRLLYQTPGLNSPLNRLKRRLLTHIRIEITHMPIIHVQTHKTQPRRLGNLLCQSQRRRAGQCTRAIHPRIDIHHNTQTHTRQCAGIGQRLNRIPIIRNHLQIDIGIQPLQIHHAPNICPHDMIRNQHIGRTNRSEHRRLFGRCTLKLINPLIHLHTRNLRHLMRLNMRTQTRIPAHHISNRANIMRHRRLVNQQRRRGNLLGILYPIVKHSAPLQSTAKPHPYRDPSSRKTAQGQNRRAKRASDGFDPIDF